MHSDPSGDKLNHNQDFLFFVFGFCFQRKGETYNHHISHIYNLTDDINSVHRHEQTTTSRSLNTNATTEQKWSDTFFKLLMERTIGSGEIRPCR